MNFLNDHPIIPSVWEYSLEPHQAFHSIWPPELRIYADFVSPKKHCPTHALIFFDFSNLRVLEFIWIYVQPMAPRAEVQIPLLHFFSPQVNTESWIWHILTNHGFLWNAEDMPNRRISFADWSSTWEVKTHIMSLASNHALWKRMKQSGTPPQSFLLPPKVSHLFLSGVTSALLCHAQWRLVCYNGLPHPDLRQMCELSLTWQGEKSHKWKSVPPKNMSSEANSWNKREAPRSYSMT